MGELDGKVAFVTGAARGQGRSHTVRMAQEGADIIAVDSVAPVDSLPYALATPEDLAETVALVERLDRRIVATETDVRDLPALTETVQRGVAEFGRLDIVLANAGIVSYGRTLDLTEEQWRDVLDVNLLGVWKTLKASVPHVIAGGQGGAIVLTSSMAALDVFDGTAHYSAAKSGLVSMMRVLARELAPHNIRINTVHPSTVATGMILNDATFQMFRPELTNPGREEFEKGARHLNLLPIAVLEPDDITNAVLYLVSDHGRYVTGITHAVDAGGALR